MNEAELAERFNKELDGVFRAGQPAVFPQDPGAMALASALARADFSVECAIKSALRARLTAGVPARPGFAQALRALLQVPWARPALAAACLLLALLPLLRRPAARPSPAAGLTAALPAAPAAPAALPSAARPAAPAGNNGGAEPAGLFQAVPMASLEGEPIHDFPIAPAGKGSPIILAQGRAVKLARGSAVVWETESAVFSYERRVITPEELFQRGAI